MPTATWTWAELDDTDLELVRETERTLDVDYVLAYRQAERPASIALPPLVPAPLDDSQLECLAGVEQRVGVVVVAYRRA